MKAGETLYGFKIEEITPVKEASGTLYLMSHKSGARLAYLDREDENKTFSIAFKTPPEDDTGVFHIIEHSTLCGSDKFPVKEPFVELLKGSLNTFLNALTYEDRTVYPVSSRCDRDFYNLTEVYLDAVFRPAMKKNPFIFSQEGWRYEYSEKTGELSYNGVVYNEMKGAYSAPEELGLAALIRLLYEGSSYGKDSGGDPEHIPSLTYEGFKAMHDKYYRPSNSYIYLDGSVDLSSILPLIGSYLNEEDEKLSPVLTCEPKTGVRKATVSYDSGEEKDGKARLIIGYPFSSYERTDEKLLSSVLISYLSASNDSPIPKALLDSGLCEDVILSSNYSNKFTLTVEIKGFDPENKDKLLSIYNEVIEKECRGMDRRSLHANLNRAEFKLRERDLGSFPVGVSNAFSVYEVWCYGGKPWEGLVFEEDLKKIRQGIDSGMAEDLLSKMIKDNPTRVEVLMLPDGELGKKKDAALRKKLKEKLDSLTDSELSAIKERQKAFDEWQASEDSEEALLTLPTLSLADVTLNERATPTEKTEKDGALILNNRVESRGITYLSFFLKASDLTEEELPLLSVLSMVLTNLDTESYTVSELKSEIKGSLGAFAFGASVIANSKRNCTYPTLRLNASLLSESEDKLLSILSEVMKKTKFTDDKALKKLLTQTVSDLEDSFSANGEGAAMGRVEAMSSPSGRINELLRGYDFYLKAKEYQREISEDSAKFLGKLEELLKRLFTKNRAIISVSGSKESRLAEEILALMPNADAPKTVKIDKLDPKKEGFAVPSEVGYAVMGGLLPEARELLGSLRVARSVLSYEYLWNAIRVKGGAYGAGFITRRDTGIYFYSYRDPSPERSLTVYKGCADYLRALAESDADLTKFIIGAYGEYDVLKTPKTEALAAVADALTDWTREDEKKLREGILKTDKEALLKIADMLDVLTKDSAVCVVASPVTIDSFESGFDKIIKP